MIALTGVSLRDAIFQHDLAGIVALGDHADQLIPINDHQRTYTLIGHQLHRLEHRARRGDRPDCVPFVLQKSLDGCNGSASLLLSQIVLN